LAEKPGIIVDDTASNEVTAISKAQVLRPDIILLDTELSSNLATVRALVEVLPASRVIALAVTEAEADVISYARAGVSGYVTRDGSLDDLVGTIRSVASGELLCSPRISAALLRQVARDGTDGGPDLQRLTPRERQVVTLIDEGFSNKEIACRLNIEVSTVKNHVHHVLEKLGTTRRAQVAPCLRDALFSRHKHRAFLQI